MLIKGGVAALGGLRHMYHPLTARLRSHSAGIRAEFFRNVAPLLENEQVLRLDTVFQHFKYTRLRHSLDVAYMSFAIARFFRWDTRSVARAGLLHDLFFHEEGQNIASLLRSHPKIALENARDICALNKVEEDIILRHMWLLTLRPPRYKEGYLVTMVDKYCAAREYVISLFADRRDCSARARDGAISPGEAHAKLVGR